MWYLVVSLGSSHLPLTCPFPSTSWPPVPSPSQLRPHKHLSNSLLTVNRSWPGISSPKRIFSETKKGLRCSWCGHSEPRAHPGQGSSGHEALFTSRKQKFRGGAVGTIELCCDHRVFPVGLPAPRTVWHCCPQTSWFLVGFVLRGMWRLCECGLSLSQNIFFYCTHPGSSAVVRCHDTYVMTCREVNDTGIVMGQEVPMRVTWTEAPRY